MVRRTALKCEPSCELHYARRVSGGDRTELLSGSHIAYRVVIMSRVQQIECLNPNLELHFSRQTQYLEERQVLIGISGSIENAASGIADDQRLACGGRTCLTWRNRECRGVEPSCNRMVRYVRATHKIGAQARIVRIISIADSVERPTALERGDAVQLPSPQE